MAVGEQPASVEVLQVLLQAAQRPRAVVAEAQYLAANPPGLVAEAVRFGEQVAVEQPDEVREAIVVAVVRRRGQQQQVAALLREPFGELIPLRPLHFVAPAGRPLRVRAALVRLVDDDQVPVLAPDALADAVLLGVVDRGDHLRLALPQVEQLLLVVRGMDYLERLAEETQQLVLPLEGERGRDQDEAAVDRLPQLELLDQQAGHDRLARAGVVGQQEAQPRLRQHLPVDRLDLVRQGADARQADRELPVPGPGEPDAGGLDQQADLLRIRGRALRRRGRPGRQQRREVVGRQHRLVEFAAGQPDAELGAVTERPGAFDGHLAGEVARQPDAAAGQRPQAGGVGHVRLFCHHAAGGSDRLRGRLVGAGAGVPHFAAAGVARRRAGREPAGGLNRCGPRAETLDIGQPIMST